MLLDNIDNGMLQLAFYSRLSLKGAVTMTGLRHS